jgi:hypothetical protein
MLGRNIIKDNNWRSKYRPTTINGNRPEPLIFRLIYLILNLPNPKYEISKDILSSNSGLFYNYFILVKYGVEFAICKLSKRQLIDIQNLKTSITINFFFLIFDNIKFFPLSTSVFNDNP